MRPGTIAFRLIIFSSWLSSCSSTCHDVVRCEERVSDDVCPYVNESLIELLDPVRSRPLDVRLIDDDADASYQISFVGPVIKCDFVGYKVYMHFYNVTEDECRHDVETNPIFVYDFSIDDELTQKMGQSCSRVRLVNCFKNLYTGCYKIGIKQLGTSPPENYEEVQWLKNKYVYENFSIKVKIDAIEKESAMKLHVFFDNVYLNQSRDNFTIKMRNLNLNNSVYLSYRDSCTNTSKNITCTFSNLVPGEYSSRIRIFHPMCDSIYGVCAWVYSFNKTNYTDPLWYTHENLSLLNWYEKNLTIILIVGFMSMLCTVSLTIWILYKKRTSQRTAQQTYDNALCKGADCHVPENEKVTGIYLIYARDCPAFMKVMEIFRKLLKKMTNCEVYDVFDSALFNEIAMSPNEWVMSHLQDPNIRVVLVATECANQLYEKILHYYTNNSNPDEHYRNLYLQPDFSDTYVSHSLKLITFDINSTPYHKFFVVRFPKFNSKKDYMTHVNPFKRFDMPENLDVLIDNIFHQAPEIIKSEDIDSKNLCDVYDENAHVSKEYFHKCVEELNKFFKDNPTYLMESILIDSTDFCHSEDSSFLTRSQTIV